MVESLEPTIRLVTSEGEDIQAKQAVVSRSSLIKGYIDDGVEFVPLPQINLKTLNRVIKYLEYLHEGNAAPDIEKPLRSNDIKEETHEWYAEFISKDADND